MKNNVKKPASIKLAKAKPAKVSKNGTPVKTALNGTVNKKNVPNNKKLSDQKIKKGSPSKPTASIKAVKTKNKPLKALVPQTKPSAKTQGKEAETKPNPTAKGAKLADKAKAKPVIKLKVKEKAEKKPSAKTKEAAVLSKPAKTPITKEVTPKIKKEKIEKKPLKKAIEKVKEVIDNVLETLPDFFSDKPDKDTKSLSITELDPELAPEPKSPASKPRKKSLKSKLRANAAALEAAAAAEYELRKASLPDLSGVNYNHFKRADRPEPEKIEAEPSVLIKTEVKKADARKAVIKNKILDKCLDLQSNSVNLVKKAMNDAQESANEEKGSMEEKFDSFRESMHITRDMYARQLQEGVNSLSILRRINGNLEHNTVILGSVVYTDFQNYFISVSLGEIVIDGDRFITISTLTPLFQALNGKSKGDKFKFRDKTYTILDVF